MHPFAAILIFGTLMSVIALIGVVTFWLSEERLKKITLPLVAFASGSLIGGAFFHMIPGAVGQMGNVSATYIWLAAGFLAFLILEQILHWHHCHKGTGEHKRPLGVMILVADGLHNLLGGLAIGALFLVDFRLGLAAWIAAAAHEIPQELGDFGILVHAGWKRGQALLFNFLSGLTFLIGGLGAYAVARHVDVAFLVPFAAGNFLYIGAVDLIPEFKERWQSRPERLHTLFWILGLGLMLAVRLLMHSSAAC